LWKRNIVRSIAYAASLATLLAACSSQTIAPPAPALPPGPAVEAASLTLTPFNAPASVFPGETTTEPTGIRHRYISATVTLQSGATLGGLYDRREKAWLQIAFPGAASTAAYGPESIPGGFRVVGSYKNPGQTGDSGFFYDSVARKYVTIDAPAGLCAPASCNYTIAHSLYGGSHYLIVGNYDAASKSAAVAGHAFLYDSATKAFRTIDVGGAVSTTAYGIWIDGATVAVAGGYTDKRGRHAYVRDLSGRLLTYDYPAAALTHFEGITGAGGPGDYNLVGDYTKPRDRAVFGFFLQVRNWKAQRPTVIGKLTANSVNRRDAIGVYNPGSGFSGFITTIPARPQ
jgi:subtilase-type serine protease